MTLAIGHVEDGVVVLDASANVNRHSRLTTCRAEFAQLLKSYRITKIQGDRYGGEWPRDRFREHGIDYETARKAEERSLSRLLAADQFSSRSICSTTRA